MDYLIWADLEMTGLEPETDKILEIATIITDQELNLVEQGPELVIHQPDSVLDNMNEWCITQHGKSGLTQKVRESKTSLEEAEQQTLAFVQKYVGNGTAPLCGNSIHQDRRFLVRYMPQLEQYLHYRIVDVSSIKILYEMWYPNQPKYTKQENHTALADIKESIEELRFYRTKIFHPSKRD